MGDEELTIVDEVRKWESQYKRLPSVVCWLLPRQNVGFMRRMQDFPSVVTWFPVQNSLDNGDDEFDMHDDAALEEDATESSHNNHIRPSDSVRFLENDDASMSARVLPRSGTMRLIPDAVDSENVEEQTSDGSQDADQAALKIQAVTRGFIDRKFFRMLKTHVREKRAKKKLRTSSSMRSIKEEHSIFFEPDGYLSTVTAKRIKERGEPLQRYKVEAKADQMLKLQSTASIQIRWPSEEHNEWERGASNTIKWTTVGNLKVEKVGLYLYKGGEPIHMIAKAAINCGKFIFMMPESCTPEENAYQILVIAEDPKIENIYTFSTPFSISERRMGIVTRRPPLLPTITLSFPVRPMWNWVCGASYKISWAHGGGIQNVQIDVMRHGEVAFRIVASFLNVGMIDYAMPLDAPTGDGFQIRVRSTTNKKVEGISCFFSIVDRQVSLAVPRFKVASHTAHRPESRNGSSEGVTRLLEPLKHPNASSLEKKSLREPSPYGTIPPELRGTKDSSLDLDKPAVLKPRSRNGGTAGRSQSAELLSFAGERFTFADSYQKLRLDSSVADLADSMKSKPKTDRFVDRTSQYLLPRIGHSMMMQSALTPTETFLEPAHSSTFTWKSAENFYRQSMHTSKFSRMPWWQDLLSDGRVKYNSKTGKILSGAEEFLDRRDRFFSEQLQLLKEQGTTQDPASLQPSKIGGEDDNFEKSLAPVKLPLSRTNEKISQFLSTIQDQAFALGPA